MISATKDDVAGAQNIGERGEALQRRPHIDDAIAAARADLIEGFGTASSLKTAHAIKDETAYDKMVVDTFNEIQDVRRGEAWKGQWKLTEETDLLKRFDVPSIQKIEENNAERMVPIEEILGRKSRKAALEGMGAFIAESEGNRQLVSTAAPPSVLARIQALQRSPWIDDRLTIAVRDVDGSDMPASTSSFLHGVKDENAFDEKILALANAHVEQGRNAEQYQKDAMGLMTDAELIRHYDVPSVLSRFGHEAGNAEQVTREDPLRDLRVDVKLRVRADHCR